MSLVGSPGRPSSDPRPGGFRSRPTPRYQPTRTTTSEPVTHHESRSLKPKVGRRPGVFPRRRAGRPSDARGPLWPRPPGRPDRGCPEFNPAGSKPRSWQSVFDPSATQDPIAAAVVHLIRPRLLDHRPDPAMSSSLRHGPTGDARRDGGWDGGGATQGPPRWSPGRSLWKPPRSGFRWQRPSRPLRRPPCVAAPTLVLLDTSHQRLEDAPTDDPIHRMPAKPAHRGQPHSPVGAGRPY